MSKPTFQRKLHRARRILDSASSIYPMAWAQFDEFRRQRGAPDFNWPDWCYMPVAAGIAIAAPRGAATLESAHHGALLAAIGTWRMTQGIYRFDPALREALLETPLSGDLPVDHLYRLPEWCVYIETGDAVPSIDGRKVYGAWVHLEYDLGRSDAPELRIVYDCARDPRQPFASDGLEVDRLTLTAPDIVTALGQVAASAQMVARERGIRLPAETADALMTRMRYVEPVLNLALYLCADAEITRRGKPAMPVNPVPVRSGTGRWMLHAAAGPTEWDVGTRIGAALRDAYQREQTGGSGVPAGRSVRPHIRRAHWHTIVSGARRGDDGSNIPSMERKRELRWMPPIAINLEDVQDLPAVIRPTNRKP